MNRTKTMPWTSTELVDLYNDTSSGHFFDKDTMRFFKSKVTGDFKRLSDKECLFITTEKGPSDQRLATIRKATITDSIREDGDSVSKIKIQTVGDFNELSLYKARKLMASLE